MQNKRLLCMVFLFSLGFSSLKAQNALYVKEKTGTQTSFTLNGLRKLTFPTGSMMVNKTDGSTVSYAFSAIRSLTFSDLINNVSTIVKKKRGNLTLYPNPVIDQLQLSYETLQKGSVLAEIIEFQGRILHRQTISCQEGTNQANISVAQLQKGLYLLRLQNGNNVDAIKFIKN